MSESRLSVTAANGTPFLVRYLRPGDRYGRDGCLTVHEMEPDMVEFYDTRYPFDLDGAGQFTGGRYHVDTLLGTGFFDQEPGYRKTGGLRLNGSQEAWVVDAETMATVRAWVAEQKAAVE